MDHLRAFAALRPLRNRRASASLIKDDIGGGAGFILGVGTVAEADAADKGKKNNVKKAVTKPCNSIDFVCLCFHINRVPNCIKVKKRCLEPMSRTTLSPDNTFGPTQPQCERQI